MSMTLIPTYSLKIQRGRFSIIRMQQRFDHLRFLYIITIFFSDDTKEVEEVGASNHSQLQKLRGIQREEYLNVSCSY